MQSDIISRIKNLNPLGNNMLKISDVDKILFLHSCKWGTKRISKELGISRRIVKKYIRQGAWKPAAKKSTRKLAGLENWIEDRYQKHHGNADVVRQDLFSELNIKVSLRTVERAVKHLREEAIIKAKATIRFETPPGRQLQIDFGSTKVSIAGEETRVYLFVATLGFSRRLFVRPFLHERQNVWFKGIEGAFSHFGGITEEILLDNAKALVDSHHSGSREVIFNERFSAFAQYWGFKPIACSPYRARTKGKDERMVGYVKRNAIAGHSFPHWDALVAHLEKWNSEIADMRIHGTTEKKPLEMFLRDEANALKPLFQKPSFVQLRELSRKVHADACIEFETNHYSVPSNLVGKEVSVQVNDNFLKIFFNRLEVACHPLHEGRRKWMVKSEHLKGIVGAFCQHKTGESVAVKKSSELLRPLTEYEMAAGGRW